MKLSLQEKIYGCLAGMAIGDALGLGTEFMTRQEARRRYPEGLRRYEDIIRDPHRRQWKRGEWTNDTDWVLLSAESLIERNGVDTRDIAERLKKWFESNPADVRTSMQWTLSQPDYLEDPKAVCARTWAKMARFEASNEALGRSMIMGLWPGTTQDALEAATGCCEVTHADPRCIGTAGILGVMAHALMWEDKVLAYDDVTDIGRRYNMHILPYLLSAWEGDFDAIEIDDEETLWYTRKSTAAALWGLWHLNSPEEILYHIVDAAGDADTNASLAMGLAGLKWGFNALPQHLVEGLLNKDILMEKAARLTEAIEKAIEEK